MNDFTQQLAQARQQKEAEAARQAQIQADQQRAGHLLATDPDAYHAEYTLSDKAVLDCARSSGAVLIRSEQFGPACAARVEALRAQGVQVEIRDTDLPSTTGTGIPGKYVAFS